MREEGMQLTISSTCEQKVYRDGAAEVNDDAHPLTIVAIRHLGGQVHVEMLHGR